MHMTGILNIMPITVQTSSRTTPSTTPRVQLPKYDEAHQRRYAIMVGLSPLFAGAAMLAAATIAEPDAAAGIVRTITGFPAALSQIFAPDR